MKVFSFVERAYGLEPIEVEMTFMPGLPKFHIMGLPDAVIKESEFRVRSALRHQGFQLPTSKQVLVNLKPSYFKKSSRGLELAIACAYLWASGQVEPPPGKAFVYGELSLQGEVSALSDLEVLNEEDFNSLLITGAGDLKLNFKSLRLKQLKDLYEPQTTPAQVFDECFERPKFSSFKFSKQAAELLRVIALGEHSAFLAGPAGNGKTTLAKSVLSLLAKPNSREQRELRKVARWFQTKNSWRPLVSPHHTTPTHSMVGGGNPPVPGELTRAHKGVLLLDEYLEFSPRVLEALREPIECGHISLARLRQKVTLPAQFLLLATTNLCPCGKFVPGKVVSCRFSLGKCRRYMERLSGPVLDRFAIVSFSNEWKGEEEVSLEEVYEQVEQARGFQRSRQQVLINSQMPLESLLEQTDEFTRERLLPREPGSRRRLRSILQVARSFADLSQKPHIRGCDIERAMDLSYRPFLEIEQIYA